MHPELQRTLTSADKTLSFYLQDDMQLLIKPKSAPYPYPLSAVDTLALANLLISEYKAIATEAKKFNGPKEVGRKDELL
jgi:hypothetical protein